MGLNKYTESLFMLCSCGPVFVIRVWGFQKPDHIKPITIKLLL